MLLGCLKIGEKRNGNLMNTWLLYYPEHQLHGDTRASGLILYMVRRGRQTMYYATLSILSLLLLNFRWAYSRVTSNSFTF